MLFIRENNTDPYFNHALEEHFLTRAVSDGEDYFIIWRNSPCVLLGRHQNAAGEINTEYARQNGILTVRRMSGGGAVYNDLGNVNFCFIAGAGSAAFADFRRFAGPVIAQLRELGVDAQLSGRNDITVEGKKISGNAQARMKGRVLHHGTLMYLVDRRALSSVLSVNRLKYEDKAVKSVEARTANIADLLGNVMTARQFEEIIFTGVLRSMDGKLYTLTDEDRAAIAELRDKKYVTWEWNFGDSPEYNYRTAKKLPGVGLIEALLNVRGGRILSATLQGDFFSPGGPEGLTARLVGLPHERQAILEALRQVEVGEYVTGLHTDELAALLTGEENAHDTD